jgi:hypothetical protein
MDAEKRGDEFRAISSEERTGEGVNEKITRVVRFSNPKEQGKIEHYLVSGSVGFLKHPSDFVDAADMPLIGILKYKVDSDGKLKVSHKDEDVINIRRKFGTEEQMTKGNMAEEELSKEVAKVANRLAEIGFSAYENEGVVEFESLEDMMTAITASVEKRKDV